jgi:hypothetical protein
MRNFCGGSLMDCMAMMMRLKGSLGYRLSNQWQERQKASRSADMSKRHYFMRCMDRIVIRID